MKKKHPEHINLERWLVSYADFITLLFAFFVILYATSKSDARKLKIVAESIKAAFSADFVDQAGRSGGKTPNVFEQDTPAGGLMMDMPVGKSNIRTVENVELKRLAEILEESVSFELGASDAAEKMQINYDERGLVVRISAKDFYSQGDAQVRKEAIPLLNHIAKILKNTDRQIRIEGHTDNSKADSQHYPSNWEVSSARASWIVRYFIKNYNFNPKRLTASGYGEHHPIASNDTPAGQAKNRRVEIVVLNKDAM